MAKKVLTSSESGADSLSDINANYTELYTGQAIVQATEKTTPVDADLVGLIDSVTGLLFKLTWANVKATLKTYFDTLYATIASLAAQKDVAETLTNKTLTSPKIETAITDTNGNEIIKTPATASAVNEITVTNAATGGVPEISATGGDTNISLKLAGKGTGNIYPQLKNGFVACTSNTTSASTTNVDITGATVTLTPGVACTMIIQAVFDTQSSVTGDIAAGRIVVDGGAVTTSQGTSMVSQDTGGYRKTVSCLAVVNLTAASHTIKLQIARASGSGTVQVSAGNTGFTYFLISQ